MSRILAECPICKSVEDEDYKDGRKGGLATLTPGPDDYTICGNCATVLRFNSDMTLREASLNDLLRLDEVTHKQMSNFQRRVREYHLSKPGIHT
jgi:hypothetical protein